MVSEIISVLLSAVPGIEAMWASAYLICAGSAQLIPFTIIVNFVSVSIFIKIVDTIRLPVKVEGFIARRVNSRIKKFEKWFGRYGYVILFVLISLPFSGIGSFTGAFIGRVLGLRKHVFYLYIFLGIAFSVVFAFLIAYGIDIIGIKC
jgi:uncharacterized membrane protein